MNIILLGAPGSGKGTQSEFICKRYSIPAISTGNIIRDAVSSGTRMGQMAKEYIDSGKLLPDDVIMRIVKERLGMPDCSNGFILDGVPRTIQQAEEIDRLGIRIDRVVSIEVPDDDIIRRLSGRRVCPACGSTYNVCDKPPVQADVCDRCGGSLITRKDDSAETVLKRLEVYHEHTEPLIEYYASQGKLVSVRGQASIEETTALVLKALEI